MHLDGSGLEPTGTAGSGSEFSFMATARALANFLLECRNYDKARQACVEGLVAEPYDVWLLGLKAICEHNLQHYREAEETARNGLSLQAEDVVCLRILALTLAVMSRYEEAEEIAQKAIGVGPEDARSWLAAGRVALYWEKYEQARERAEKALALDADLMEARWLLVTARTDTGKASKAEVLELLAQHPDSSEVHRNLGWLELVEGRLREAETCFLEALSNAPEEAAYRRLLLAVRRCRLPLIGRLQLSFLRCAPTLDRSPGYLALILLLLGANLYFAPGYPVLPVLVIGLWMLRPVGNLLVGRGPLMVARERLEAWLVIFVALASLLVLALGWEVWYAFGLFTSIIPLILAFIARDQARAFSAWHFLATATLALLQLPAMAIPMLAAVMLAGGLLGTWMVQL